MFFFFLQDTYIISQRTFTDRLTTKTKTLLEELTVPYLHKKFPALYGTRRVVIIERDAIVSDANSATSFTLLVTILLHDFFNSRDILQLSCINFFVFHNSLLERSSRETDGINPIVSETHSDLPYRGQSWE
jgi:hypothetical protein